MSVAAAQASAFYREAILEGAVWTIRDDGGFPAPMNSSKRRVQPFWSKDSRARKVIENVSAYAGFATHKVTLRDFLYKWLPGLERDGLEVGLNWSGDKAVGYDVPPARVRERLLGK